MSVPHWGYGDTVMNEFCCASGVELTESGFEAYMRWSEREATGLVVSPHDDSELEFFVIRLDASPLLDVFVAYPRDDETTEVFRPVMAASA